MKGIEKKIISTSRKYRLDIPSILMKGMGWEADPVEIVPNPEKNILTIKNPRRKAVGSTDFMFNVENAKWIRNKKQYRKQLNDSLSKTDRKILHGTDWSNVEDGGYWNVKLGLDFIKDLKVQIADSPKELRFTSQGILEAHRAHTKALLSYLEKRHKQGKAGKKPEWFKTIEKEVKSL